jgi:all-trans-retinol 13,14-reductase
MKQFDVVIIGSGLGGLVCGYILGKNGYKVGIFEKNNQIGGCLQTFKRKGVSFDTGMHYIGSMEEGQIMHRFFKYLNLLGNVGLMKLDKDGFDQINLGDDINRYAMGYENFIEGLSEKFPAERAGITEYVSQIKNIAEASPLYNLREINAPTFIETYYIKSSASSFIRDITSDEKLRNVLAGTNALYAGVPDKTPLYIHALINNFYIQSAWRIVGGSDSISNSLAASIKTFGGEIFTNSEVKKINTSADSAISVELTNGEIISGKKFISDIHPQATIEKLETPLIRRAYRDRINSLENTVSIFTLYLVFKPKTVKYLNFNIYQHNTNDVWNCQNYTDTDWPRSYLYMHQADSSGMEYARSAQVIAYMNYRDVIPWENTSVGKRGNDYLSFKKAKAERLLDDLEKRHPGFRDNIESFYTSTPLTYKDYTATKEGSTYGILRDCNFPTQTLVSQRTKIPNLFLTGQNINSHGILGVTIGAIITCAEFLGINKVIKDINE